MICFSNFICRCRQLKDIEIKDLFKLFLVALLRCKLIVLFWLYANETVLDLDLVRHLGHSLITVFSCKTISTVMLLSVLNIQR